MRRKFERFIGFVAGLICVNLLCAMLTSPSRAQASAPVSVLGNFDLNTVKVISPSQETATSSTITVTGQKFDKAVEIVLKRVPANRWDVQVVIPNAVAIHKGDTLLLSLNMRAVTPTNGSARIGAGFERASPPYNKSLDEVVTPTASWERVNLPFRSDADYAPGTAHAHFVLGFVSETVDLAQFSLFDYGPNVAPETLPHYHIAYAGEEKNATWRQAADERIAKFREADVVVVVKDSQGNPVPGAKIHLAMTRHSFDFGTAVNHWHLLGTGPPNDIYRTKLTSLFTKATVENELKWTDWYDNPAGRQTGIQMVDWLDDHHIAVRGHNLVWPSWQLSPRQLRRDYDAQVAASGQDAANRWLESTIEAHITDEVGALKGKVVSWDVINEPVSNHDFMDLLGKDAMVKWFQVAHAADPNARLYLNDYQDFHGSANASDIAAFQSTIRFLKVRGAPIGGIGLESHFQGSVLTPEQLIESLAEFSKLGLPIEITEYDFKTDDPVLQADFTRDFLTLCFSCPAVESFVTWGFWDGAHWLNDAPLFNKDWSLKPSGKAYEDLVYHKWWTDKTVPITANGHYETRGFLGDYVITVTHANHSTAVHATIKPGRNKIVVTL